MNFVALLEPYTVSGGVTLALDTVKKMHGEGTSEVGLALAHLASIFAGMNRDAEALDCYEQSVALREKLHQGRDHAGANWSLSVP